MKNNITFFSCLVFVTFLFSACQKDDEPIIEPTIPEFVYAGGETTIFDATSNAYATPAPNLNAINFDRHLDGDLAFEQIFVTSPATVNPGLGPAFNNNSCVSCHVRNGRSTASTSGDELSGFLLRLSIPGENAHGGAKPVPYFGTQLQTRAIFGKEREANFTTNEINEIVTFMDGSTTTISKNEFQITEPYMPLPSDLMISPRVAPAVYGLGLLEAIPANDILALADENDADGDGISGKPNRVWNIVLQNHTLGRFGWKAEAPTALQQTADAFHQDMGITTSFFPEESCSDQPNCEDDNLIDIDDDFLGATNFYVQSLAVPAVRNYEDEIVLRGKDLFETAKCSSCHTPKHITGNAEIAELTNQVIFPYTDLLLHDMGEGLTDNRPSFEANGREWRTAPLWGIGLLSVVNGHTQLMHDGRANNLTEAILWHGGEGEASKQEFLKMSENDRNALIKFLESL